MTVRPVLRLGHPSLRQQAAALQVLATSELAGLIEDLPDTMAAHDGARPGCSADRCATGMPLPPLPRRLTTGFPVVSRFKPSRSFMPSYFPAADSPDSSSEEVKMLHLLEQLEIHAQKLGSDPEITEPRRSYWKALFLTLDLYGDRIKALKRMDG